MLTEGVCYAQGVQRVLGGRASMQPGHGKEEAAAAMNQSSRGCPLQLGHTRLGANPPLLRVPTGVTGLLYQGKTEPQSPYLLVCELLCMNQLRLLSTYMAQALSSLPSMASFRTSMRATPKAGSGWLS